MKKFLFSIFFLGLLSQLLVAAPQSRLVLHGVRHFSDSTTTKVGVAGWANIPDLLAEQQKHLVVAGVRLARTDWWLEIMSGRLANKQTESWLIDCRQVINFSQLKSFQEVQYFPQDKKIYWTAELGFAVNWREITLLKLSGETENIHQVDKESYLSLGPKITLPLSQRLTVAASYLFTNQSTEFIRTYTIINL